SAMILLVCQLELSSLRNVVRMMLTLSADAELDSKIRIIVNRFGSECDISQKKAEETIGKPIFWQVPNDPKSMMESRNQGVPLVTYAPRSKVQQSFVGLVAQLTGKETQAPPQKAGRGGT